MKSSIFKATAILSSSSAVSIVLSLVLSKVMAVYLQPAGYGYYGVLQSFVAVAALVTGMGISTGLVRMGAAAASSDDQLSIASLRCAAWWLFAVLGSLSLALLVLFRVPLSLWAIGSKEHAGTIVLMAVALLFTVAATIETGTLNAYHRVEALAKCGISNTVCTVGVSILSVLLWRIQGVVPAIIGGAIASWFVARYFLRREIGPVPVRPQRHEILKQSWSLLRFGSSYTASMLVGTGVQLALPIVVLHLLSAESVGYYKASVAISVGYLGFLVTAMAQDYYPRVSAVAAKPDELVSLVNEQHRLVMILAVPMILGTLALVPIVVPLVYSHKFSPTVEILEWQLIGDLFKFSSWTMSFVILARCRSSIFFLSESIGGVVNLIVTWLAVRWFGLSGLGISFLITYMIYYVVVWVIVRREIALVWTASNKRMMLGAVAAALVIRVLPSTSLAGYRSIVALGLAALAGAGSLCTIWRELSAGRRFAFLRRATEKV